MGIGCVLAQGFFSVLLCPGVPCFSLEKCWVGDSVRRCSGYVTKEQNLSPPHESLMLLHCPLLPFHTLPCCSINLTTDFVQLPSFGRRDEKFIFPIGGAPESSMLFIKSKCPVLPWKMNSFWLPFLILKCWEWLERGGIEIPRPNTSSPGEVSESKFSQFF